MSVYMLTGHRMQRLLGFWVCYHELGGVQAMIATGYWPRSTVYKQLSEFRELFGCHPDDFQPVMAELHRIPRSELVQRLAR